MLPDAWLALFHKHGGGLCQAKPCAVDRSSAKALVEQGQVAGAEAEPGPRGWWSLPSRGSAAGQQKFFRRAGLKRAR